MKTHSLSIHSPYLYLLFLCFTLLISCQKKEEQTAVNVNESNIANDLQIQADSLYHLSQLDSAFNYYLKSNQQFQVLGKTESVTYNNLRISTIYLTIGDPNSAQELITQELSNINNENKPFNVFIYNALATCYAELEDYNTAIKNYEYALTFIESQQEKYIVLNNIASIYINIKEYTKAIAILKDITSSNVFKDLKEEQARSLNNLGKALYLQDKTQGLQELKEALVIRLENVNQDDIYRSYINIAEYYTLNKDYKSAHDYALKAYQTSKDFKSKKDKLTALEYLIKSSVINPTQYYADYIELSKQIATETQQAKNQFAKIRYDFEQHEKENIRLKLDLQDSELMVTRRNNVLLVAFISFLLGAVVISFIYRKIKYKHR
ncbi:MAG: tetratricopeptide repeat protein, partial [Flavobacterium sp.]